MEQLMQKLHHCRKICFCTVIIFFKIQSVYYVNNILMLYAMFGIKINQLENSESHYCNFLFFYLQWVFYFKG